MKKSIHEHAEAIEAAIWDAYVDGFELDDGDANPIFPELNYVKDGDFMAEPGPVKIHIQTSY